jgi:DNA-binding NarL/FixJ family response regulator
MPADREQKKSGVPPGDLGRLAEKRGREKELPPARGRRARSAVLLDLDPSWVHVVEQTLARLGVEVVGTALKPGDELVLIREHAPDLLVIGTRTRGREMDSLACLYRAREEAPQLKAIMLSDHDDPAHIEAALRAGASAYITKPKDPADFATAIRQVFEPSIFHAADAVDTERPARASVDQEGLTRRELDVLRHVAEGRSNAEVGRILWVTEQTVKFHLSNIYRKLGVLNRTEASRRAQTLGLLSDRRDAGGGGSVNIA